MSVLPTTSAPPVRSNGTARVDRPMRIDGIGAKSDARSILTSTLAGRDRSEDTWSTSRIWPG
jgi:hypothetical protein